MKPSDKVRSSETGKIKLKVSYKQAGLTIAELAAKANISEDTIKRLLGTKECLNGVERWQVNKIAEVLEIQPTDIVDPKDWYGQNSLPPEFESLIAEKTRTFCGRRFVFDTFEQFIKANPCGYFTIVGDAGMGKSSIAAKYISEYLSPCYFNILVERRNRPELFLKSIRRQLIDRYQLLKSEDDDLATLLANVARKLTAGERLVIAIDALDEVEQEPGENLLHLPKNLPNSVYFLLTRRPYNPDKKGLLVDVPERELDLRDERYVDFNHNDITEYIQVVLKPDSGYQEGLKKWIQTRSISEENFVGELAKKSENNFMYLRYVLPAIACGDYNDFDLKQLPKGLQEYYQNHWVRMGMEAKSGQLMEGILYILLEIGTPIPCGTIAGIVEKDEYDVKQVLEDDWVEYLKKQNVEEEICYTIYHASFLDFLKTKRQMDSKRKIFQEVNQQIVDYLQRKIAEKEDSGE
ncbi:MAG: NACHT domain-containing protein [Microcoleus sp. SU_5_6]|nr:NACHT domain-containing protein [Microcoleus sp. SU_5_6]